MNSDTSNDKNSDKPGSKKKFVQISPDSIQLIVNQPDIQIYHQFQKVLPKILRIG